MSAARISGRPTLADLLPRYDLVVVGGGITGAGVLREASRLGAGRAPVSALLVERGDYASGTSSGSSKLIHGGLRYLKAGEWRMTFESVRERERLLRDAPGLVEPQPFLMPFYSGRRPGLAAARIGFAIADLMAGRRNARTLDARAALAIEPMLASEGLRAAIAYRDGVVDDARLVLRLLFDAIEAGAHAINHVEAEVDGSTLTLTDRVTGEHRTIGAGLVVLATGVWGGASSGLSSMRPLRGSHLVYAQRDFPLGRAIAWMHPRDGRPVFAHPWEGAVLVGTTDLDHPDPNVVPTMSAAEADYLVDALRALFPGRPWQAGQAIAAFAGLRPIVLPATAIDASTLDPSAMPRDSFLWSRPGLVGVAGGKLTTYRATAREVLREAARQHAPLAPLDGAAPFTNVDGDGDGDGDGDVDGDVDGERVDAGATASTTDATTARTRRLRGRLGATAARWIATQTEADRAPIGATPYCRAELRWSLRHEHVARLDDLLLRRTRLGLVAPRGGIDSLPGFESLCRDELGWDAARWAVEAADYTRLWNERHAPPRTGPKP